MKREHSFLEIALDNILVPAQKSDPPLIVPPNNTNECISESKQLLEDHAELEDSPTNMNVWLNQIDESIEQDMFFDDGNDDNIEDSFEDPGMDVF